MILGFERKKAKTKKQLHIRSRFFDSYCANLIYCAFLLLPVLLQFLPLIALILLY